MGSVAFRANQQLQFFMKDSKWNSSFVDTSKMGFNHEPFFLSRAVCHVKSTTFAARHPRSLDLGFISDKVS